MILLYKNKQHEQTAAWNFDIDVYLVNRNNVDSKMLWHRSIMYEQREEKKPEVCKVLGLSTMTINFTQEPIDFYLNISISK